MSEQFTAADVTRLHDELTRLRAALVDALKANRELASATLDAQIALAQAKAALDALKRHHDLCRAEAGAPDDDVLLGTIKALKADLATAEKFQVEYAQHQEQSMMRCVAQRDSARADAEALATALQGVVYGYSSALISYDAERLKNVLAAYRHPAPKEPLP